MADSDLKFVEFLAYFEINPEHEKEFLELMGETCKQAKEQETCYLWGMTRNENTARVRAIYADALAAQLHFKNSEANRIKLQKISKLQKMEVSGPEDQLESLKPAIAKLNGIVMPIACGFSRLPQEGIANCLDIVPHFTFKNDADRESLKVLLPEAVDASRPEKDCLYYGFSVGEQIRCIEAYRSAAAILEHISNVSEWLKKTSPLATVKLEIHGPEKEFASLKEPLGAFGVIYFPLVLN